MHSTNIIMLQTVANGLGKLKDEMVFVGGGMKKELKPKYKKRFLMEPTFLFFHQNIIWPRNLKHIIPGEETTYVKATILRTLFTS